MYIGIDRATELLKQGEIVSFPTETVYGLGADAWNPSAIQKVFEVKRRPADNPLIVHVASKPMIEQFAREISPDARELMNAFWPGPLTLIFPKKPGVLDLVTAGLDTVALRWPSHPVSQELIYRVAPLVAPSANLSGHPSPTIAQHVIEDFGEDFPVIDGGSTQIGLESTVLDLTTEPFTIHRPGFIDKEKIEQVLKKKVSISDERHSPESEPAKSPGTKYSHYAPSAEVRWLDPEEKPDREDTLYLLHGRELSAESGHTLHYHGDFEQLARELYDRFREADHLGLASVAVEPIQGHEGIRKALINRIQKAIG